MSKTQTTLFLLKRDDTLRSAHTAIRPLLRNFQNKAEDIATVVHNMDPECVSVFITM